MAEINRLYAKALFDLAQQYGNLEACLDQAVLMQNVLKLPESLQILENPLVKKAEKFRFLKEAFPGTLEEPLASYVELLIDKSREGILLSSLTEFLSMGDCWRGIVEAHVVSACELRPEQVSALHDVLERKLEKTVDMTMTVDPSLIGGFYLNVGGYTVDSSVRRRLQDMKRSIERGEGFDGPQT